jgi:hypothetical protein
VPRRVPPPPPRRLQLHHPTSIQRAQRFTFPVIRQSLTSLRERCHLVSPGRLQVLRLIVCVSEPRRIQPVWFLGQQINVMARLCCLARKFEMREDLVFLVLIKPWPLSRASGFSSLCLYFSFLLVSSCLWDNFRKNKPNHSRTNTYTHRPMMVTSKNIWNRG